jgi:hypothetical protein
MAKQMRLDILFLKFNVAAWHRIFMANFNQFSEVQFERLADYFSLRSLCFNSWKIVNIEPFKLFEVEFFWAPQFSEIGSIPKMGFWKSASDDATNPSLGAFTGLRHFGAAIYNVGRVIGDMTNWRNLNKLGDPLGALDVDWIPDSEELDQPKDESNCEKQFPFPVDLGFRTGSWATYPKRYSIKFHLIRYLVSGNFEARHRLPMGDVLWPEEEFGPVGLPYPHPFFQQWNLYISIIEPGTSAGAIFQPYIRKPRFAGRSDRPHWREQHQIISIGRKFRQQQKKLIKNPNAKGFGRKGTGVAELAASTKRKLADPVFKKLERAEQRKIDLELKLATMKAETGFDKEKLRRTLSKCRDQAKGAIKKLKWRMKRKEIKARFEKVQLRARVSKASARCNVPRTRRRKPRTRNWRRSTARRRSTRGRRRR